MNEPSVAVIVLTWNQRDLTLDCLASLEAASNADCQVIVVDNGSTDDSVQAIRESYPGLDLLETGANLGYAGGNNAGVRQALAQGAAYVCILNNDVTVEPGFLAPLVAALAQQPNAGVATPLVAEQSDDDRRVWALGSAVNWRTAAVTRQHAGEPVHAWRQQAPFEVEIASGAAMLVKAEVFQRAGLMDEAFFLYFEETDWCLRIRQTGYRILAVPASVVWHKVSATLGTSSPMIDYYMLRNHLRFIGRHWRMPDRGLLLMRVAVRNLATIAAYTVKPHGGRRIAHRNARLKALRDAAFGRWGGMGPDVARICYPSR